MFFASRRAKAIGLATIVFILTGLAVSCYVSFLAPERKPINLQEKPYEYYIVIDEASGKTLTYVTSVGVHVGDEYLDENGQWYKVVRVEENRAYAKRFDKKR